MTAPDYYEASVATFYEIATYIEAIIKENSNQWKMELFPTKFPIKEEFDDDKEEFPIKEEFDAHVKK